MKNPFRTRYRTEVAYIEGLHTVMKNYVVEYRKWYQWSWNPIFIKDGRYVYPKYFLSRQKAEQYIRNILKN